MAVACPQCGDSSQVLHLPEFWRSLSQDAELKRELAQPPAYEAQWIPPLALLAGGVWVFTVGQVLLGLLLLAAGLGISAWVWRTFHEAEEARARWQRLLYCRRCPTTFTPEEAKAV